MLGAFCWFMVLSLVGSELSFSFSFHRSFSWATFCSRTTVGSVQSQGGEIGRDQRSVGISVDWRCCFSFHLFNKPYLEHLLYAQHCPLELEIHRWWIRSDSHSPSWSSYDSEESCDTLVSKARKTHFPVTSTMMTIKQGSVKSSGEGWGCSASPGTVSAGCAHLTEDSGSRNWTTAYGQISMIKRADIW